MSPVIGESLEVTAQETTTLTQEQIADYKKVMIEKTPITAEQFDEIDPLKWPKYEETGRVKLADANDTEIKTEDDVYKYMYNTAVEENPVVFEAESKTYRDQLAKDYGIDRAALDTQVNDIDLFWAAFEAWQAAGGQEDVAGLAKKLQDEFTLVSADATADLIALKDQLIKETPLTETQYSQIPDEKWSSYQQTAQQNNQGVKEIFNQAVEENPIVFGELTQAYRNRLEQEYHLDRSSLDAKVDDLDLLWAEYKVWSQAGTEDFASLAKLLADQYGVPVLNQSDVTTPTTSAESTTSIIEPVNQPSKSAAIVADLKKELINKTPLTEDQFAQISSEKWLTYHNQAVSQGKSVNDVYAWAVEENPVVFEALSQQYRNRLASDHGLDRASLDAKVDDLDLFWTEYQVWLDHNGQEDFADLANRLVKNFGVATTQSAQVEKTSSVESQATADKGKGSLPDTGESNNQAVIIGLVVVLAAAGAFLLLRNRKS